MPEAERIEKGKATKRRFDTRDFHTAAEFICDDLKTRKAKRKDLERQWDEIDRQAEIKPDKRFKCDANGIPILERRWAPEMELSDQAQTLEVVTADAKRMILPAGGEPWFSAHVNTTDEYLQRVEFNNLVSGDQAEIPSKIAQENADRLIEGLLVHNHRQYDFGGVIDGFNVGAVKHGTGLARARLVRKSVWKDTSAGIVREDVLLPRLFAQSVRNVYLDDTPHKALGEGSVLSPSIIATWKQLYADLVLAANKGSSNLDRMDGGWLPAQLKDVIPDEDGNVEIAEYEGDLVVSRKATPSFAIRNHTWTVVKSQGDPKVIRLRKNPFPFLSYIYQPYHVDDPTNPYGKGPLMLGRSNQIAGTESLNRLMQWAILNTEPPIKYDRDDAEFEANGGPRIEPRALWRTLGKVEVQQIGDGAGLLELFSFLQSKYADVTGVNAPRLGAQTVSHTTAFAKEAELSRGTVRTVDYVSSLLSGALTRWLYMEYEMTLKAMDSRRHFFHSDAYGGFVQVTRDDLPDQAAFEVFGTGGPLEKQAKSREKITAMQFAIQIELMRRQAGEPPSLDLDAVQRQILREGGWIDLDPFFTGASAGVSGGIAGPPGVAGAGQNGPGAVAAPLQAIQGGGAA